MVSGSKGRCCFFGSLRNLKSVFSQKKTLPTSPTKNLTMSSGTFEVLLLALRRAKRGGSPSIETQRGKDEAFCFNLLCFR